MSEPSFIRPEPFWRSLELRAQQTIVHLGAGPGYYLIPAAHMVGKGGQVIGVDIRPDMLAEITSRAKRAGVEDIVRTVRANLEQKQSNSLPAAIADWVLVANILHQAEGVKILSEARRLAKPTGIIVVVEWDTTATPLGPPSEQRVSKSTVQDIATSLGLHLTKEFRPSPYHYGLLFSVSV